MIGTKEFPRVIVRMIGALSLFLSVHALAQPVEGDYSLDFFFDGELILSAHIEDSSGNPAPAGSVSFQYCSYKGLPRFDITQPDEAPLSACADGSGKWVTVGRAPVNPETGDALLNFGLVTVVNVIGFRYRYIAQGSGIANKLIDPVDWIRE